MNEEFNDNQFDNERMNRGNNDDTFEGDALKEANKVTDLKKNQKKIKTASKVISLTAAFSGALLVALGLTNIFTNNPNASFSYSLSKGETSITLNYSVSLENISDTKSYYLIVEANDNELSKDYFVTAKISSSLDVTTYSDNTSFSFKVFDDKNKVFKEETYIYKIPA